MQKIGVIVAMEKELSPVLGKLGSAEIVSHHPYFVKKITLGSSELYLVKSGVGEISAAGAAQFLLTAYGCEALWNFGVVGGLTDEMDFNRVVLVDRVVHYAFDTSAIDHVAPGFYVDLGRMYFETDRNLLAAAKAAFPDYPLVTIASADRFVAKPEEKQALAETFSADVCDMESAAVALIALRNKVPFFMMKAVSDSKNDGAKFNDLVHASCEAFSKAVVALLHSLV